LLPSQSPDPSTSAVEQTIIPTKKPPKVRKGRDFTRLLDDAKTYAKGNIKDKAVEAFWGKKSAAFDREPKRVTMAVQHLLEEDRQTLKQIPGYPHQ
jgi:hypothetical protein